MAPTVNMKRINPIEHLWDVVEQELRALDVHPLKSPSTARCYPINMGQHFFQHLVESMLCRIKAVLKAKGVKHSITMVFLIIL